MNKAGGAIRVAITAVALSAEKVGPMPEWIDFTLRADSPESFDSTTIELTHRITRSLVLENQEMSNADYLNWALANLSVIAGQLSAALERSDLAHGMADYEPTLGVRTVFDWEEVGLRWKHATAEDDGACRPAEFR